MTNRDLALDLSAALKALHKNADPAPEAYERVARWRRACGDAEGASTWQTWSLLPPTSNELREALAILQQETDDHQPGTPELEAANRKTKTNTQEQLSWEKLLLLLKKGNLERAKELQAKLLNSRLKLSFPKIRDLSRHWQAHHHPDQALSLLESQLNWMEQKGEPPAAHLCSEMAKLLETQTRYDDAELWWKRSHALQPEKSRPLIGLCKQALRNEQAGIAFHYSHQVLAYEPQHKQAQRLQRKALQELGALKSLALLRGNKPAQSTRGLTESPPQELWQECRSVALIGFSEAKILRGWCTALRTRTSEPSSTGTVELWLIASPDPLWLEYRAKQELNEFGLTATVLIHSWPVWDQTRHQHCDRVFESKTTPPFWRVLKNN